MTGPTKPEVDSARCFAAWLAALFLVVLGAKLWVVQLYGSPMWLWDQWYEVLQFFKPWLEGRATGLDYFEPYNEHRIFCTRMLDMGVIVANGRLEPLLQMTVDCFIYAGYVCALAFCLWDFLGRKSGGLICCLLMPFFALPYAGENTIWAFDSQAYFQGVFSLATLVWMGFNPVSNWRWWLGLFCAVIGLFTMASGLLAPAAVAGLAILRMIKRRQFERNDFITLGVGMVVAILGKCLLAPFPADEPLKAHSLAQFGAALLRYLSWPYYHAPEMAVLIAMPLILLAIVYFRPSFRESRAAEFLLVMALWSALQSVALAYGRGNMGEEVPASRYMDKLNIFVVASLFALLPLVRFRMNDAVAKKFAFLPLLVFAAVIFFGLVRMSQIVVENLLESTRLTNLVAEERVQKFMADGNEKDFFEAPTVRPDPKVIEGVLLDPKLQPIMPAANLAPSAAPVRGRFSAVSDALWRHAVTILYAGLVLSLVLIGAELARNPKGLTWENLPGLLVLLALLASLGLTWAQSPIHRETVERRLDNQLAIHFKFSNQPARAAFFEARAKALEGK